MSSNEAQVEYQVDVVKYIKDSLAMLGDFNEPAVAKEIQIQ